MRWMVFLLAACLTAGVRAAETTDAPTIVRQPERWLDFQMAAPQPEAIRPDGRQIVVQAGCETVVYTLDPEQRLHAWTERFSSVEYSADGRLLVTVRGDQVVVSETGRFAEVRRFAGRAPAWNDQDYQAFDTLAALSDDGAWVAVANRRGSFDRRLPRAVLVYELQSGELLQTLATPEKAEVDSMAFVPHGGQLIVRYREWTNDAWRSVLWDARQGDRVREFPSSAAVRVSDDGRWIAASAPAEAPGGKRARRVPSGELTISERASGKQVATFRHGWPVRDYAFSPDGRRILVALEIDSAQSPPIRRKGQLVEWDVPSKRRQFESEISSRPFVAAAYSPDGLRRFATTEEPNGLDDDVDHRLCGWSVETNERLPIGDYVLPSYNGGERLFFFRGGEQFIDLASREFAIRDVLTGKPRRTLPAHRTPVLQAAFHPDGEKILVAPPDVLADLATGRRLAWHLSATSEAAFVDRGRLLFAHDFWGFRLTDVFSLFSDAEIWRWAAAYHSGWYAAAVSADARRIVSSLRINVDPPTAARLVLTDVSRPDSPRIHVVRATALAFHPEGARFLAAALEAIEERDATTGERIRTLWTPPGRPLAAAYSSDGRRVLVGGVVGHADDREPVDDADEGWAMLWNADTQKAIRLAGHAGPVTTAAFGPGGDRCATGSLDKTVRLWDSATGKPLCVFSGHLGAIHRIAYSPRGDRILSAAGDGAALWNVARWAGRPVQAVPLAAEFRLVEPRVEEEGGKPTPNPLLPRPPGSQRPAHPAARRAPWPVIEVRRRGSQRHQPEIQDWLMLAGKVVTREALPPSAQPAWESRGYQRAGVSRDGQRELWVSQRASETVLLGSAGQVLRTWPGRMASSLAALSPSGREVVLVRPARPGQPGPLEVTVYDADSGAVSRTLSEPNGPSAGSVVIDPQEKTLLIVGSDQVLLVDYRSLRIRARLDGGRWYAAGWTYSPDGRFVASIRRGVGLYRAETLQLEKTIPVLFPNRWFQFTPDGKRLLVGQEFGREYDLFTMFEVDSGRELWSRVGPSASRVTFSPLGHRFLTVHAPLFDPVWTFWDAEAGQVLCAVLVPGDQPYDWPVLSRDSRSLHLGSADGPRLWPAP